MILTVRIHSPVTQLSTDFIPIITSFETISWKKSAYSRPTVEATDMKSSSTRQNNDGWDNSIITNNDKSYKMISSSIHFEHVRVQVHRKKWILLFVTFTVLLSSLLVIDLLVLHHDGNTNHRHGYNSVSRLRHDKDGPLDPINFISNAMHKHEYDETTDLIITKNDFSHQRRQQSLPSNNETICDTGEDGGWVQQIPKALQFTLITILILFSAFFSGLTLSMMGLDTTGLEIVMSGDDPVLSRAAAKILPVRKNGNLLLCTLLLGNVAVNTLLGILMADITGGTVGFITSTGLIVIFGEILPQALFSRYALQVGEKFVPLVKVVIAIMYILAKPLAFCLDKLLGHELGTTYSKAEMSKLLEIHVKEGRFNQEVGTAMKGALQYQDMVVKEVMTPLEHTFMINIDDRLNFETMSIIFKTGYSRIPVYEGNVGNVMGLLFVKDLIFIDPEDATPVRNLMHIFGRGIHFVWPDDKLGDVLRYLKAGHTHMALVRGVCNEVDNVDPYYTLEGIITLEDIIEVILGDDIVDETDAWVDADHTTKVSRESTFDWSKLRLLDAKIVDETLSEDEVRVVAAHLRQNYSFTVQDISDKQLNRMIGATPVTELGEVERDPGESLPPPLKCIYEKNEESSICTLILSGKVTVLAGNDNFRADMTSWSILATGALTEDNYSPDFSAYVSSGPCRCLQFSKEIFQAAVNASILEKVPDDNVITKHDGSKIITPLEIDGTELHYVDGSTKSHVTFDGEVIVAPPSAPSVHSSTKAEDIVERSEQRGRLLATLFKQKSGDIVDSTRDSHKNTNDDQ